MHARLEPGIRLSEQEISLKLGVSRTPVREAFINLASEGLVEILPQRGTFVTRIDLEDVRQTTFIRESLETSVLLDLCGKVIPEQIGRLRANLQEQKENSSVPLQFYELDDEFHRMMA